MVEAGRVAKVFQVTGRVQGVFFRAGAKRQADRLGLRGYARNLPDGRVEVLAVGEAAAVASLGRWLRRGSEQAQVAGVTETGTDAEAPPGFEVR